MGEEFTAKDFRTWGGTLIAAIALAEHGVAETETRGEARGRGVMRTSASGSETRPRSRGPRTSAPRSSSSTLDGRTIEDFRPRHLRVVSARDTGLDPEEQALLSLLRSWRIRRARKAA